MWRDAPMAIGWKDFIFRKSWNIFVQSNNLYTSAYHFWGYSLPFCILFILLSLPFNNWRFLWHIGYNRHVGKLGWAWIKPDNLLISCCFFSILRSQLDYQSYKNYDDCSRLYSRGIWMGYASKWNRWNVINYLSSLK